MSRLQIVTDDPMSFIVEEAMSRGETASDWKEVLDEHEPILQIGEENVNHLPGRTYLGRFYVTGYDICMDCCGKLDGITASGAVAQIGRTVAAPQSIPFGTTLYIEGIGERVVEDRGGLVTGEHLDVLCANHSECYAVTGWYDVYIVEGAA